MSLHIDIPDPLAERVAVAAKFLGKTAEDAALEAISLRYDPTNRLSALAALVHQRMAELGESEDEAVGYFEQIKHDLRRERRAASQ